MQYLVIARGKEFSLPVESWATMAETGIRTIEYLKNLEAEGKVKISGAFGVEWGGYMVLDVDSFDEVTSIILMCPGSTSINWEVHPIATWQGVTESLTKFGDKGRATMARRQQSSQQGQGSS
ncbi:MAG: YciI family protein [Thaumarchaeota archaeon]|nr:YciI family protein [Nitrososphaerota archaeon]